ncbi:ABC transporter permease [Lacisediminihabitans profunda]|uniref:ABC transporter permease n=1 Tax=Lacisediminihabitans profunda TaxID=2594790 RepID=UPI00164F80F5|nr:ABC transporter permease [Lacisediminihabitans profunda]
MDFSETRAAVALKPDATSAIDIEPRRSGRSRVGAILFSRNSALVALIVLLVIVISIVNPHYSTLSNIGVLARQTAILGIPAIGMTLLIVAGYVDLSIGSVFSLVSVSATVVASGLGLVPAILLAIVLGALIGLINGALVWRIPISPLIVTLGGLTFYQGVVNVATQGQGVNNFDPSFQLLGAGSVIPGIPNPVMIFVILAGLFGAYLARTTGGLNIVAIGGNRESAEAVGIPVRRVVIGLFALNGAIIGLAAVLTASNFGGAAPSVGVGLELSVLTAVILGGVSFSGGEGNVLGTVLAVILLTVVNSGIVALNIDSYYSGMVSGALLVFAVGLDQLTEEGRSRYRRLLAMRAAFASETADK